MSKFFTQKHCDRCGASLASGRIMSMLNTDCICMKCKDAERQHPEYERAREREREEVRKGNRNYAGFLAKAVWRRPWEHSALPTKEV